MMEIQKNILLFGPQGSGKGTQGERLAAHLGIPLIGTGALLRAESRKDTSRGKQLAEELETGNLVTESMTNAVLFDRLQEHDTEHGFLLDGYPRNQSQQDAFDVFLKTLRGGTVITRAIALQLSDDQAIARLSRRRVCGVCGAIYHTETMRPKTEGVCDACGGEIIQRSDDTPEAIQRRLTIYHTETAPLLTRYEEQGILTRIDASGNIDDVFRRITYVLNLV